MDEITLIAPLALREGVCGWNSQREIDAKHVKKSMDVSHKDIKHKVDRTSGWSNNLYEKKSTYNNDVFLELTFPHQ